MSEKVRIFATAFERKESCKQEKHCDIVLYLEFAKIHTGGLSIYAFACSVCYRHSRLGISSGVRYVL